MGLHDVSRGSGNGLRMCIGVALLLAAGSLDAQSPAARETIYPTPPRRSTITVPRRWQIVGPVSEPSTVTAARQADSNITEFPVPTPHSYPGSITAGPDGNLWFTETFIGGGYGPGPVARITPSGVVTEFPLLVSSDLPVAITSGPDGSLWFTIQSDEPGDKIGRITPAGHVTTFVTPTGPSGPYPTGITTGPDGNIWFAENGAGKIGSITPAGAFTELGAPRLTPSKGARPSGIVAGPDDALWYADDAGLIGRVSLSGAFTTFPLPPADGNESADQIALGPDGNLWFTEYKLDKIGRITPAGVITEFPIPGAGPYGIRSGPDGNIWFTEATANKIGQITPAGVITEFSIPTANSAPTDLVFSPDGSLWFTESAANQIGRLSQNQLSLGGSQFQVNVTWTVSPTHNGVGTPVPIAPDTGAFWFFTPNNLELMIKVLDGRAINGHWWILLGSLSTVEFVVDATDLSTGATWTYHNPAGSQASYADVEAFSNYSITLEHGRSVVHAGLGPGAAVDPSDLVRVELASQGAHTADSTQAGACVPDTTSLCLSNSRFRVQVAWDVPDQGRSGVGTAAALTGDTGTFWFFSPDNLELIIKVLDARVINDHFWIFYGALSDVEYTITVTDTETGAAWTHHNPYKTLSSFNDTSAF